MLMTLKILFIEPNWRNTQGGIRINKLTEKLIQKNIVSSILTRKYFSDGLNSFTKNDILYPINVYREFNIALTSRYVFNIKNYVINFDYHWIIFAYIKAKKILKKDSDIKFIYCSGPPFYSHIIGFLLKRKFKNLKLILEYRDPWSFNPYHFQNKPSMLNLTLERTTIDAADYIITISSALKKFIESKFSVHSKNIISIPNGFDLIKNSPELIEPSKIVFTFTGSLYSKRDITPLFKIISCLKKEGFFENIDIQFKIFGDYNKKELSFKLKELKISEVVFLGSYLSREDLLKEIYNCTIAIHIGENLNYPTIAFKVWDYLSCRKKILYIGLDDSFTAEFLKKNQLGIIIPINNLDIGKKILKDLILRIFDHNIDLNINNKKLEKFTWSQRAYDLYQKLFQSYI